MSLHLDFEPHSWYMGFAIMSPTNGLPDWRWHAYTDDGMMCSVIEKTAKTLPDLKYEIRSWHLRHHTGYGEKIARRDLSRIRGMIDDEIASYGEIAELQGLVDYIDDDDVQLLEWAGAPEGSRTK